MPALPEAVWEILDRCQSEHRDSIDDAIEAALKAIPAKALKAIADDLLRRGLRSIIEDLRCKENAVIRRQSAIPPKPKVTAGAAVNAVAEASWLRYVIAGQMLGDMTGGQLAEAAEREEEAGQGKLRIAALCRRIKSAVPDDSVVRECVTDKQISLWWSQVGVLPGTEVLGDFAMAGN